MDRYIYVIMRDDSDYGQASPITAYTSFMRALRGLKNVLDSAKRHGADIDPYSDIEEQEYSVVKVIWESGKASYFWIQSVEIIK